jgi:hypothetical protein
MAREDHHRDREREKTERARFVLEQASGGEKNPGKEARREDDRLMPGVVKKPVNMKTTAAARAPIVPAPRERIKSSIPTRRKPGARAGTPRARVGDPAFRVKGAGVRRRIEDPDLRVRVEASPPGCGDSREELEGLHLESA